MIWSPAGLWGSVCVCVCVVCPPETDSHNDFYTRKCPKHNRSESLFFKNMFKPSHYWLSDFIFFFFKFSNTDFRISLAHMPEPRTYRSMKSGLLCCSVKHDKQTTCQSSPNPTAAQNTSIKLLIDWPVSRMICWWDPEVKGWSLFMSLLMFLTDTF